MQTEEFATQLPTRGRRIKFTPERLQQIRNLVERGKSREEIAELIGVTVGSLQVTCSRLGISLRRVVFSNRMGLLRRSGQPQQNSRSGPVEQPQATTPHEEHARTDDVGLANLALGMKYSTASVPPLNPTQPNRPRAPAADSNDLTPAVLITAPQCKTAAERVLKSTIRLESINLITASPAAAGAAKGHFAP